MKNLIKIITIFILILSIFGIMGVSAEGVINFPGDQIKKITDQSIKVTDKSNEKGIQTSGTISDNIKDTLYKLLTIIKIIVSGLLVIFIVYIGIQMILSMGSDEDKLTKSKTQLRYTLMALIFINIPGTLYNIFTTKKGGIDGTINGTWSNSNVLSIGKENVFINIGNFTQTINGGIVLFIESAIFTIAIFMIILSGIKIMLSRGTDENIKESKNKIIWSLIGLVFVGFIESWQTFVYQGKIEDGATIFHTIENLVLFFAGPIAIFFLTLAGYYYITSNGDEEKVKKAKNIIINTIIATIILLASHLFLTDLSSLTI